MMNTPQESDESNIASSGETLWPFSSDLLVEVAHPACTEILARATEKRPLPSVMGSRIGTVLHLIACHIEVVQPYQLPVTAQDLCYRALQDLMKFCKWRAKSVATKAEGSGESIHRLQSSAPRKVYDELKVLFTSQPAKVRAGITNFLNAGQNHVEYFADRFQELLDLLDPDNRNINGAGKSSLHVRHLKPHDEYVYPDSVRENLTTALKKHVMCVSSVHKSKERMIEDPCHLTRLHLSTTGRIVEEYAKFDIVVAVTGFHFWQNFSLETTLKPGETPKHSYAPAGPQDETNRRAVMKVGEFCHILEREKQSSSSIEIPLEFDHNCHLHKIGRPRALPYAKTGGIGLSLAELLVSDKYNLTPRNKIMLSFSIARSFWEFYGTDLSTARWCSEDIWFMPRYRKNQSSSDHLELRAFVSFSFGQDARGPPEFLEVDDLTHGYPRILSLGVTLLEIGRGEKFRLPPLMADKDLAKMRDSVNDAHCDASSQLDAFKDEVWETCRYKNAFDDAIWNCLDPTNFIEKPSTRKKRSNLTSQDYEKLSPEKKVAEDQKRLTHRSRTVQDRRDAIFHNVVAPLYWLAKVGNADGKDDLCIKLRKQQHVKVQPPLTLSDSSEEAEIRELWKRVQAPKFMSNQRVDENAKMWFEGIRTISTLIFTQRHFLDVRGGIRLPPVRIAILDTGCNLTLNSLREAKCFKGWADFAVEPPSETEVDEYGHGTFMARLLMQMVPGCELYIARIAQTAQQLEHNDDAVAKAIKHAGKKWEVDVISMSFGYPKFSQSICDAIYEVKIFRKDAIVFLASAGNDVNRSEAYPACDPSVISMYAARSTGTFLESNPIPSDGSQRLLGTYGDNVPEDVLAELRAEYTEADFSAGTSVATAVAAGVVGSMLAYAALLPHKLPGCGAEGVYSDLKTTDGMRQMLFSMANSWNTLQYFINPVRFWSYRQNDPKMYREMCSAIPQKEVLR